MTDEPQTKKSVKNLKHNMSRSDKHHAKSGAPKLAPPLALEMAKTTLRKASQQRSSSVVYRSMVLQVNAIPVPPEASFNQEGNPNKGNISKLSYNPTKASLSS